ncbi:MAG: DUF983 domain-containing protein [Proteobacteria bacterium]|nr:DUF983 domain-containing protein [Pseudomonadota bacterium]
MSLVADLLFAMKPRCPACRRGRLFKPYSVSVVEECSQCHAKLGKHDVGDGASVFLIFLLGVSIVPAAWLFECLVAPPLWVHVVLWGFVALGMIALILPTVKAFIILLEYRHRPGEWKKN